MPHAGQQEVLDLPMVVRAPALLNGWTNLGSGFSTAGYYKDDNGIVHLRGVVKSGSLSPLQVFTLPVGFRPSQINLFCVQSDSVAARVDVGSNGDVLAFAGGTVFLSLDGISFLAA